MSQPNRPRDEFALIEKVTAQLKKVRQEQTVVANGDDAAVFLPGQGKAQVVALDTMVEGVHFTRQTMQPHQIGHKVLASNLSDLAAMGAQPTFFLVSLAVSPEWSEEELEEIYGGMGRLAEAFRVELLGGDTVSAPRHLVISVTAIGEVDPTVKLLRRSAQAGHKVFVTGWLGLAAAGLDLLLKGSLDGKKSVYAPLLEAHQEPWPHVKEGLLIAQGAQHEAVALNDVSDGLASEANEIARASGVDLVLEKEKLPVHPLLYRYAVERGKDPYRWVLAGGEDFVLVGTASSEVLSRISELFAREGLSLFEIGRVEKGEGRVWLEEKGGRRLLPQEGYNHFNKRGQ